MTGITWELVRTTVLGASVFSDYYRMQGVHGVIQLQCNMCGTVSKHCYVTTECIKMYWNCNQVYVEVLQLVELRLTQSIVIR